MGTTPTRGGPLDPRITKIKEIQSRNPGFSRHQAIQSLGVAASTLNRWVAEEMIEPFPVLGPSTNSPWKGKRI
jgi:hypothetical protein